MTTGNQEDSRRLFRPSGRLLEADTTLGRAIEAMAVTSTGYNSTIIDLLMRLWSAPGRQLRGVDLGRQLLKSPGYVSRVIDQAEDEGLVRRTPDPDDRRAQQIQLTAAGEAVLEAFVPRAVDVLDRTVYRVLDQAEVETLIDILRRITDAAREVLDQVPGD